MIKRIMCIMLSILLASGIAANAMVIGGENVREIPADWTTTLSPSGAASADMQDGNLHLSFDTTDAADRGRAEITTGSFDFKDGRFFVTMNTSFTKNDSKVFKSLTVTDDSVWNAAELFRIREESLSLFGGAKTVECSADTEHQITVAVNSEISQGAVWLDNELIFSDTVSNWKTSLDMSKIKLVLKNSSSSKVQEKSDWSINGFLMKNTGSNYKLGSIPQNGQKMVETNLKSISLNFGMYMGDIMQKNDNYELLCNDETTAFDAIRDDDDILIVPDGGVKDLSSYKLKIKSIRDILGTEYDKDYEIAFTTAFVGYKPPTVTLDTEKEVSAVTGQRVHTAFSADKNTKYVEIIVNGETVKTITEAPYEYNFTPKTAGTVTIQAAACDEYGGKSLSDTVTINVSENKPPIMTVSGITDGGVYTPSTLPVIEVRASDDDGVSKIKMLVDGTETKSVSGDSASFSMTEIAGGKRNVTITAEDIYGASVSESFAISIEISNYKTTYTNDFSDYTGGLPQGMVGGAQRGYLEAVKVDDEHGNSLAIGIDTADENFSKDNTAYVGIPEGNTKGTVQTELDIYIAQKPSDRFRLSLKKGGGEEQDFMYITSGQWQVMSGRGVVGASIDYEEKRWYHVAVKVNIAAKSFDIYIDQKPIVSGGTLLPNLDRLDQVRIFGPSDDSVKTYAAVDNVVVNTMYILPQLTFNDVNVAGKKTLTFASDQQLSPASLTAESVKLSDEFGAIDIERIKSDGSAITIYTASEFKSNMEYKITLSPKVMFKDGPEIGVAAEGKFKTSAVSFAIMGGEYDGGSFRFTAVNPSGNIVHAAVISQIFEDGRVQKISVEYVDIAASENNTEYSVPMPEISGDEYIITYIWDGLINPVPLSPFPYIKK